MPTIHTDYNLADLTSFGVGGPAEKFASAKDSEQLIDLLKQSSTNEPLWLLGYGTNILISDQGLPGLTIHTEGGDIRVVGSEVVVDAGVWWDDLVLSTVQHGLWGLELTSGVPGGVGAALYIHITAYGQSASTHLEWIEVFDQSTQVLKKIPAPKLEWGYKSSIFQEPDYKDLVIVRAKFNLPKTADCELQYQWALDVAQEMGWGIDSLQDRRKVILETRRRAGSLYRPNQKYERTAGSFFRNPIVSAEQAEHVIKFDESNRSLEQLRQMNKIHGGDKRRVSANHVMLAAGFRRGQSWGPVRLHPDHVLKIENTGGASAQQIYDVAQIIITTVKQKLNIDLEPEVRIVGDFNQG